LTYLHDISNRLQRLESAVLGESTVASTDSPSVTTTTSIPPVVVAPTPPAGRIDVVLGAQWGDEGKGKLVDLLAAGSGEISNENENASGYDVCCRVAGGANAGHTIVVQGVTYKFHLLPSGILCPTTSCIIGNGVVVHLPALLAELDRLAAAHIDVTNRIWLSDRAHLVFDFHMMVDGLQERRLGRHSLGTTHKGIGPAYASKISRNGLRVADLQDWPYFERRYRELATALQAQYPDLKEMVNIEEQLAYYRSIADRVGAITCDTIAMTQSHYAAGKRILVEGANATMLDIDFGTYPYVTSSNPSIGSVLTGLGVAPQTIRGIYGTVKAYCTRVGAGPFPTELDTDQGPGRHLATVGVEVGTTTGRPRRTGWLDIPQMKYASQINGFTALNLTKLDVLTGLETIQIATGYKYKGEVLDTMPASLTVLDQVEVVFETLPGWTENLSHCRSFTDLPVNAQRYVLRCQELIGVPIRWIGIGPGRDDIIDRGDGWDLSSAGP
jgi:adenylosuccinate synthase